MMKITDALYEGLWALFFCTLAMAGLFVIYTLTPFSPLGFNHLSENFGADVYDTAASVMVFRDYGLFGNAPLYSSAYSIFGNFPPLFAIIAGSLDMILRDPFLSMNIIYWATELAIIYLLWTRFLKHCEWKTKLLFIILFLVDIVFGNLFPFGYRRRQQLAILGTLLLFLAESRLIQLALAFLILLAQPVVGVGAIFLKAAGCFDKKRAKDAVWDAALFIVPAILAYPFYAGLLHAASLEPDVPTALFMTVRVFIFPELLLAAGLSLIFFSWRKDLRIMEIASFAIMISCFLPLVMFVVLKDFFPADLVGAFIRLSSSLNYEILLNVVLCGFAASILSRKCEVPRSAISILLILSIVNLGLLPVLCFSGDTSRQSSQMLDMLEKDGISHVKTLRFDIYQYSGGVHFLPLWSFFWLQSYSMLHERDMAFVDEFNLPPTLSKGESNTLVAGLPESIYYADMDGCRNAVGRLRSHGVEAIIYGYLLDPSAPADLPMDALENRSFLDSCGIKTISGAGNGTIIYDIR